MTLAAGATADGATQSGPAPVPAIRYSPRGRGGDDRLIVGLAVAAMSFFEAYLRSTAPAPVTAFLRDVDTLDAMRAHAAEIGCDPGRLSAIAPDGRAGLAACGAVLMQDPAMAREATLRAHPRAYSLIGVTHSLSSRESWREIMNYPRAPLQPWDALVCTTRAGRAVVDGLLDQAEEDARRAGATEPVPRPALPIIPLGIDAPGFAPDAGLRAQWRRQHAIADDDVVVLFLGRLSLHAKAHPYALVAACAEARRRGASRLRLAFAGQFPRASIGDAFRQLVAEHGEGIEATFIESPTNAERRAALAGADIFASFADSIQETFGLAPVEAMAAGLPVVVTDWDGYRDTVRHGRDGFRVPTLMAPPPAADGALRAYSEGQIDYDRFCAVLGQMVAVDVRAAASAIHTLAVDPELRRRMGESGRTRVAGAYDWPVVMAMWRKLWEVLAEIRAAAPIARPARMDVHARPDPLRLFRSFPTRCLGLSDRIVLRQDVPLAMIEEMRAQTAFRYAFAHLPAPGRMAEITARLAAARRVAVGDFLARVPGATPGELLRTILFLAKRNLLAVMPVDEKAAPARSEAESQAPPAGQA